MWSIKLNKLHNICKKFIARGVFKLIDIILLLFAQVCLPTFSCWPKLASDGYFFKYRSTLLQILQTHISEPVHMLHMSTSIRGNWVPTNTLGSGTRFDLNSDTVLVVVNYGSLISCLRRFFGFNRGSGLNVWSSLEVGGQGEEHCSLREKFISERM